tara:strand:- start:3629 stop:4201 length:573 start_codon:yes stop_codon:yes gene_type:complete
MHPEMNQSEQRLLKMLAALSYRHGKFKLASGLQSEHYVNCKPVTLSGSGLFLLSGLLLDMVEKDSCAVAGLTLGADPLVSGVAMCAHQRGLNIDALIVRKEPKGHGTEAWLEGPLPNLGARVTVLEDVVTTGGSSIKAVNHLRNAGYVVERVVTIVDREEGAKQSMVESNLELKSLFQLKDIANFARDSL